MFEIPALASPDRFEISLFIMSATSILFFISEVGKKKILIADGEITIKQFLHKPFSKPLRDITHINWGSPVGTRQIWMRSVNYTARIRNDYFSISFRDGYTLEVNVKEYSNFDELRGWFLTYCRKAGILKIRPLHERKRRKKVR